MPLEVSRTLLLIVGMRDNGCRELVVETLRQVDGVREVHVNLYRACATIVHQPPCAADHLIAAITRAGYGAMLARDGTVRATRRLHRDNDDRSNPPDQEELGTCPPFETN
jgi:copper chaperone CopZ